MVNPWERLAASFAMIVAFCVLGCSPLLRAQDKPSDLITHKIGWEISTGHVESALADASRAIQEFPNSAVLMHLLAVAQSKNGLQEEARESFNKCDSLGLPRPMPAKTELKMQLGAPDCLCA